MSIAARSLHGINVCLIPHPDNDHKPLALRHKPLALVSCMLILVKIAMFGFMAATPNYAYLSTITTDRVIQLTNNERTKAGLPPLTKNPQLSAAAHAKAHHMLAEGYFAHISPSGVTPWYWIQREGYTYRVAGENLAVDFSRTEDIVSAWMASPTHKANIMHTTYTETGVGIVTGEFQGSTSTIVVHMFGTPQEPPQPEQESQPIASATQEAPVPSQEAPTATPAPQRTSAPPQLELDQEGLFVQHTVPLRINANPKSTIHILVNNTPHSTVKIPSSGRIDHSLDVTSLPDGSFSIQAYSAHAIRDRSNILSVTKHATAPKASGDDFTFVIPPAFDTESLAVVPKITEYHTLTIMQNDTDMQIERPWTTLSSREPLYITLSDEFGNTSSLDRISIAPAFNTEADQQVLTSASQRVTTAYQRITLGTAILLLISLALAIGIRIRIQHPSLIAHTSLVILLAGILFLL